MEQISLSHYLFCQYTQSKEHCLYHTLAFLGPKCMSRVCLFVLPQCLDIRPIHTNTQKDSESFRKHVKSFFVTESVAIRLNYISIPTNSHLPWYSGTLKPGIQHSSITNRNLGLLHPHSPKSKLKKMSIQATFLFMKMPSNSTRIPFVIVDPKIGTDHT